MKLGLVFVAVLLTGCPPTQDVETAAKCAATRMTFDRIQTELIDRGLCDAFEDVQSCPAHMAAWQGFKASLVANKCGTPEDG